MERSSSRDGGPALYAVDGREIGRSDDAWPPRATGRMIAVPAWRTRGEAMRAAGGFNRLVDQNAAWVPPETIDAYRAACDASPEDAQFEFLGLGERREVDIGCKLFSCRCHVLSLSPDPSP